MRFLKTKLHIKHKGFSLVEVMCAIVLLAIVVTPIIQIAFNSLSVNARSRKYLTAADITSDTMEFISSLTFEDYSYTDSGNNTRDVPGLRDYYYGKEAGCNVNDLILKDYGELYPGYLNYAPEACVYYELKPNGAFGRVLTIQNVMMDNVKFDVKIDMQNTLGHAPTSDDLYFTYDVTVSVYEAGKDKVLSSAKTSIANKY